MYIMCPPIKRHNKGFTILKRIYFSRIKLWNSYFRITPKHEKIYISRLNILLVAATIL